MNDQEIIAAMVKGRECCRRLVQSYETARTANGSLPGHATVGIGFLATADNALTRMLVHLKELPQNPGDSMKRDSDRHYATRLLGEISGLLEKAMILEREVRDSATRLNRRLGWGGLSRESGQATCGILPNAAGQKALRAYGVK